MREIANKCATPQHYQKLSCRKETMRLLRGSGMATCNRKTLFCQHYRSIFNHCDVIGLQKLSTSVK